MVGQGQEGRPARALRQQDGPDLGRLGLRRTAAAGQTHALRLPEAPRPLVALGQPVVEAGRQDDLIAPALPALPAGARQQVGGRGERVGVRAPDVHQTVARLVHAQPQEIVGHELGLAHRPGPAALQARPCAAAVDHDVQRVLQLGLGPVAAPAVIGQRRQRADHVVVALHRAEGALLRPDGQQDLGRHAIALHHLPRHTVGALLGLGDPRGRHRVLDVGAGRPTELRLVPVQPHHGRIGRQAGQFAGVLRAARAAVAVQEAFLPAVETGLIHGRLGRSLRLRLRRRRHRLRPRGFRRQGHRHGRRLDHRRTGGDGEDQQEFRRQAHGTGEGGATKRFWGHHSDLKRSGRTVRCTNGAKA